MKFFNFIFIMVLCFSLTCCGKSSLASLNEVSDPILFGATPEEAGGLLGIDFTALTPETEGEGLFEADVYRVTEQYLVYGYPADLEIHFFKVKTPKNTPLGLAMIILYFDSDVDIEDIADHLITAYRPDGEPSYKRDLKTDAVESFYFGKQFSTDGRKKISAAKKQTFGEDAEAGTRYTLQIRRRNNQDVMLSIVAIDGAIENHIEDYLE